MPLQRAQRLIAVNHGQSSVWVCRYIRQSGGAVATNAITAQEVDADIEVLLQARPAGVGPDPAACARVIERSNAGRWGGGRIGIDAVPEIANDPKHLIVSETGLECRLHDEIRRVVE